MVRLFHIPSLLLWGVVVLVVSSCTTLPQLIRSDAEAPPPWIETAFDPVAPAVHVVAFGNGDTRREAQERAQADAAVQIAHILSQRAGLEGAYFYREVQDILDSTAEQRSTRMSHEERWFFSDFGVSWGVYALLVYDEFMIREDLSELQTLLPGAAVAPTSRDASPREHPLGRVQLAMIGRIPTEQEDQRVLLEAVLQDAKMVSWDVTVEDTQIRLGDSQGTKMHVTASSGGVAWEGRMIASIRGPLVDGSPVERRVTFTAPSSGSAAVEITGLPVAGDYTITITPEWLPRHQGRWEEAIAGAGERETLAEIFSALTTRQWVEVTSVAASIPTAVIITDRDIAGNVIPHHDSGRGLVQALRDQGFRVEHRIVSPAVHRDLQHPGHRTVADLYDILPFEALAGVERLIIGNAEIVEFTEGDRYSLRIEFRAQAYDLLRERHLGDIRLEERVSGGDPQTLIRTGFLSAGRRAARQFGPRLP